MRTQGTLLLEVQHRGSFGLDDDEIDTGTNLIAFRVMDITGYIVTNIGFESRVLAAMKDIPVRMVGYGGSNYNISLLVRAEDKERTLQSLSRYLFL